mgnify:CR=1 FL=1
MTQIWRVEELWKPGSHKELEDHQYRNLIFINMQLEFQITPYHCHDIFAKFHHIRVLVRSDHVLRCECACYAHMVLARGSRGILQEHFCSEARGFKKRD